jgi:hypothetical protein
MKGNCLAVIDALSWITLGVAEVYHEKPEFRISATCSSWFLARGYVYPGDGGDTFLQNIDTISTRHHIHLDESLFVSLDIVTQGLLELTSIFYTLSQHKNGAAVSPPHDTLSWHSAYLTKHRVSFAFLGRHKLRSYFRNF